MGVVFILSHLSFRTVRDSFPSHSSLAASGSPIVIQRQFQFIRTLWAVYYLMTMGKIPILWRPYQILILLIQLATPLVGICWGSPPPLFRDFISMSIHTSHLLSEASYNLLPYGDVPYQSNLEVEDIYLFHHISILISLGHTTPPGVC